MAESARMILSDIVVVVGRTRAAVALWRVHGTPRARMYGRTSRTSAASAASTHAAAAADDDDDRGAARGRCGGPKSACAAAAQAGQDDACYPSGRAPRGWLQRRHDARSTRFGRRG
eukprot:scaffold5980_cov376-Prasinococcus_capsulatus_cf.AAC.1